MSSIRDALFMGAVRNLFPQAGAAVEGAPPQEGFGPMGRVHVFTIVPLAAAANNIALAQIATALVLTAGAGVTTRTAANQLSTELVLDVPRNVTVTAAGANTGVPTIRGFDQYGQPMTEVLAAPSTSTVTGKKAFKVISSVTMSATPGSNITVGTGTQYGLPAAVRDKGFIVSAKYNGADMTLASDITVADQTAVSGTTGDVRGTALGATPDGIKRMVVVIALDSIAVGPNATRLGLAGLDNFAG